jgi:hypothetical protein
VVPASCISKWNFTVVILTHNLVLDELNEAIFRHRTLKDIKGDDTINTKGR